MVSFSNIDLSFDSRRYYIVNKVKQFNKLQ